MLLTALTTALLATNMGSGYPHSKTTADNETKLFTEHSLLIKSQGRCKYPQPRLVYVTDVLTTIEPDKMYWPRATILHRCDNTTGCCDRLTQVCKTKEEQKVDRIFMVVNIHNVDGKAQKQKKYQWITFSNHTRCGCVDAADSPR